MAENKKRIKPYQYKDLSINVTISKKLENIFEYSDEQKIKLLKNVEKDMAKCDTNIVYYQTQYEQLSKLKKELLKDVSK